MQERTYANREGSPGPSATAYVDRDGTIVRAIDPAKYAARSQGDVAHSNTKIPIIAGAVCLFIDAAKVPTPVNLFSLGWAFVVTGALVVGHLG